jgi:hypothetical protein
MEISEGEQSVVLRAQLTLLRSRLDALLADDADLTKDQLDTYKVLQNETLQVKRRLEEALATKIAHFRLKHKKGEIDLCISHHTFLFSKVVLTSEPSIPEVPASDAGADLPVSIHPHTNNGCFEVLIGLRVRFVDEMRSMRELVSNNKTPIASSDNSVNTALSTFEFEWVDGTRDRFVCNDFSLLEEVVGAHLRIAKRRRVYVVECVKELWGLQRVVVDAAAHDDLLRELWKLFFPEQVSGDVMYCRIRIVLLAVVKRSTPSCHRHGRMQVSKATIRALTFAVWEHLDCIVFSMQ